MFLLVMTINTFTVRTIYLSVKLIIDFLATIVVRKLFSNTHRKTSSLEQLVLYCYNIHNAQLNSYNIMI